MKIIAEHLARNGEKYFFADDRKIYKKDKDGNMIIVEMKSKDLTEEAKMLKEELRPGRTDEIEDETIKDNDLSEDIEK